MNKDKVESFVNLCLDVESKYLEDVEIVSDKNPSFKENEEKILFNLLFYEDKDGWKYKDEIDATFDLFKKGVSSYFTFNSPDSAYYPILQNNQYIESKYDICKDRRKRETRKYKWRLKRNNYYIFAYFSDRSLFSKHYKNFLTSQYFLDCSESIKNSRKQEQDVFFKALQQLIKINTIKETIELNTQIKKNLLILKDCNININYKDLENQEKMNELIEQIKKQKK